MTNSRTILEQMKRTAFLALVAAAWSCEAVSEPTEGEPAELAQTGTCAEGTEPVSVGSGAEATVSCQPISAIRLAACPAGAQLTGEAPPRASRQRCEGIQGLRHGASSEWYASGRDRTYTEWWQGVKHGAFKLWYENGQVRAQGFHVNGKPAGEWIYYAEDGRVLQRRTFDAQPPAATWLAEAIAGRPPAM
jgi:MORN repeat variant